MAKNLQQIQLDNFATGLNTEDSPHDMENSDLRIADNVVFRPTGEVESINGLTQIGPDITVNSLPATKILGSILFEGQPVLLASNGTISRLVRLTPSESGTFTWTEIILDLHSNAKASMVVYQNKLWVVNGIGVGNNILHIIDSNLSVSSLTRTQIGLSDTRNPNRISLHLERIWLSEGNRVYVSRLFPTGSEEDWDTTVAYSGADTAGMITIDDDTEDSIQKLVSHFGQLVIFREKSIHVVTGDVSLTGVITRSFDSRGTIAPFSVGQADKIIYFLSREGVKRFEGTTTQDQQTQFDTISTITLDRKIRPDIDQFSDKPNSVGHAFRDAYYFSDGDNTILVFDEFTGGWSKWNIGGAETFLENGDNLFIAKTNKYYHLNSNLSSSILSRVRTKDFNLGSDNVHKIFERLLSTFKTVAGTHTITIEWYINGSILPTGTQDFTINGESAKWDSGLRWDSGIRWDTVGIDFITTRLRKLNSGTTISFGVKAEGTNRFSLSALLFLFEPTRREF